MKRPGPARPAGTTTGCARPRHCQSTIARPAPGCPFRALGPVARPENRRRGVAMGEPRVILLGGLGRSGTTLVERIVGELPGVVALGEVVHLWRRDVRDNE